MISARAYSTAGFGTNRPAKCLSKKLSAVSNFSLISLISRSRSLRKEKSFPHNMVCIDNLIGHLVHRQGEKRIGHSFPERDDEHRGMFARRNRNEFSSHTRRPHVMTSLYFRKRLIVVDMLRPIVKIDNDFGVAVGKETID